MIAQGDVLTNPFVWVLGATSGIAILFVQSAIRWSVAEVGRVVLSKSAPRMTRLLALGVIHLILARHDSASRTDLLDEVTTVIDGEFEGRESITEYVCGIFVVLRQTFSLAHHGLAVRKETYVTLKHVSAKATMQFEITRDEPPNDETSPRPTLRQQLDAYRRRSEAAHLAEQFMSAEEALRSTSRIDWISVRSQVADAQIASRKVANLAAKLSSSDLARMQAQAQAAAELAQKFLKR